jgi:hypothetical protein
VGRNDADPHPRLIVRAVCLKKGGDFILLRPERFFGLLSFFEIVCLIFIG